jgi:NACalpha-BTF3-like transcription factor
LNLYRKKKAVHKATTTDDKRLQSTLKRLNVNTIPGIEEVMLIADDKVTVFSNPKVQASIAANTYVVSGPSTERCAPHPFSAIALLNLSCAQGHVRHVCQTGPVLKQALSVPLATHVTVLDNRSRRDCCSCSCMR